jgi:hypothetical protein
VPSEKIRMNILRLEKDMKAELETIQQRYETKIA